MLSKHCEEKARKHSFFSRHASFTMVLLPPVVPLLFPCSDVFGRDAKYRSSREWRVGRRRRGVRIWWLRVRGMQWMYLGGGKLPLDCPYFLFLLSYLRIFNIVPLTKWSKWQWHSTIGIVWREKKWGKTNWIWVGWDGSRLNASSIPAVRRLWWPLWYAPLSFRVRTNTVQARKILVQMRL